MRPVAAYLDVERWEWRERDAFAYFSCVRQTEKSGGAWIAKKKKSAGKCQPLRILREISTIENGAGIQNSGETKTRLSLSLSVSFSVCALWPTTRHLHLWTRHLHLWTWPRIRMNIRFFRIDGVCVVNKGSFRVLKPVFKFLKVYYVVSLHWKEVRKLPGRRIALPVSLSNLCI